MKKILLLLACCTTIFSTAFAQVTYLADTSFATDAGFGGAEASCVAPHETYLGWQMGRAQDTWLADLFTVPSGTPWAFDTVIIYGYQFNSGTASTFLNCNLQIYDNAPGLGGSVIWGDTSTNVLVATGFTGIYRVDTVAAHGGLTNTERPIMYLKLHLSPAPVLAAGTYWLSWSSAGSLSEPTAAPDKVLSGRVNPTGQQARQFFGGVWNYIDDNSNTVGMDKIIKAKAGLTSVANVNTTDLNTLSQNTPNPANTTASISFRMQHDGYAQLSVFNILGQLVKTLTDGNTSAGAHTVALDVTNMPSAIYFCKLTTETGTVSMKMQVVH